MLFSYGDYVLITTSSSGEERATEVLCLIALLPIDSISQSGCPISHTHTHTNTFASALQSHTVSGALSYQLVTYCYQWIVQFKSARHPRELQRILPLHFRGTELDPWWRVQKKLYTYKPGSHSWHKPGTSALHCAYPGCGNLSGNAGTQSQAALLQTWVFAISSSFSPQPFTRSQPM